MNIQNFEIRVMSYSDLSKAQEIAQETWSDMASRELGKKIKLPIRPRRLLEAYLKQEPHGCFVVEYERDIIGAAYCHTWGKIGWIGPFEILPEMQGKGIGRALLSRCELYLTQKKCTTIGLETMTNISRNIDFYLRSGYKFNGTSIIMEKGLTASETPNISCSDFEEINSTLNEIDSLCRKASNGLDLTPEIVGSCANDLGAVFLLRRKGLLRGFSVIHSLYPIDEADHAALRLLLVDNKIKDQTSIFQELIKACEHWAFANGRRRIFVRFSGEHTLMYEQLVNRGYKLDAVNVRMYKGLEFKENATYMMAAWAG